MNNLIKFKFIFIIFFFINFSALGDQQLKFLNVDEIIKKTNIGSQMLSKISEIDQSNIEKLKYFENELKTAEDELNSKKNLISSIEFEKELKLLKNKIKKYNNEKNLMSENLNKIKNEEIKIFFEKINPIIQSYMNKHSIDIIFNNKDIFMANKKSDLTKLIIDEINNKL